MAVRRWPRYNRSMSTTSFSTTTVAAIAAVSGAALGSAFVAQYGFGMQPCELCLLQRTPYQLTLVLGLLALIPAVPPQARRQVAALCAGLFAVNAVIAGYHAGIEYRWWKGPTACTGSVHDFDLTDLTAALNRPGRINCEDAAIRVFGISMAGGNVIACTLLALGCLWAVRRERVWDVP